MSEAIFILRLPFIYNNCDAGENSWESLGLQASILWLPDAKNWLIRQDPDAGKDWKQKEEEMTEDEMVGWHHRLNGHEFEQALGVGDGQGGLACYSPWGHRVGHDWVTELNWTAIYQSQSEVLAIQWWETQPRRVYKCTSANHDKCHERRAENSDWITMGRAHAVAGLAARNYSHALFFLSFLHDRGWEANHDLPDSLACSTVLTN